MPSAESDRLISLIKNAIRLSNYTYREVERQLGWRVGTVTRLMRGGLGLKIEHLLSILRIIHFSPGRFFAAAFPAAEKPGLAEDRLFRLLEQMYADPEALHAGAARSTGGPTTQDEIDEMVRASLRKLIGTTVQAASEPEP